MTIKSHVTQKKTFMSTKDMLCSTGKEYVTQKAILCDNKSYVTQKRDYCQFEINCGAQERSTCRKKPASVF